MHISDQVLIAIIGSISTQVGTLAYLIVSNHFRTLREAQTLRHEEQARQQAKADRARIEKRIDENTVVTASQHPELPGVKADLATVRAVSKAAFERLRESRSPGFVQGDDVAEETEVEADRTTADQSPGEGIPEPHSASEGGLDRPDHLGGGN